MHYFKGELYVFGGERTNFRYKSSDHYHNRYYNHFGDHSDAPSFAHDFEKYSGNWTTGGKLFTERSYASAQTVGGMYQCGVPRQVLGPTEKFFVEPNILNGAVDKYYKKLRDLLATDI